MSPGVYASGLCKKVITSCYLCFHHIVEICFLSVDFLVNDVSCLTLFGRSCDMHFILCLNLN